MCVHECALHVQSGFGWTNGVILDLLHLYGSSLSTSLLQNMTNSTNATDPNTTNTDSSSNSNRDGNVAWVVPIAVLVPLIFLCVVCVIWGRWVYKRGKKRYWQRVQNEHLMAYGATEDTGQYSYGIGELYENKYFAAEHLEDINENNNHTIKGDEDEQRKSLRRQNSANGKNWYDEDHVSTIPAVTASRDSGILSNRTSDNVSDNTVVDKVDEESNVSTPQQRNGDEDSEKRNHGNSEHTLQESNDVSSDEVTEHLEITVVLKTKQEPTPDKILTSDV